MIATALGPFRLGDEASARKKLKIVEVSINQGLHFLTRLQRDMSQENDIELDQIQPVSCIS
jgi:hypothetical protein